MLTVNLITSNAGKVEEFKIVIDSRAKINHINKQYKELRSDDPEEIAKDSAKRLAEELNMPVVVEDSGLFINELKGFPGTCSAYIHKKIGLQGILRLMEGVENRSASYKSAVAYCEHGNEPISFLGEERGKIAESIRGNYGFGHDPIFIPEGSSKTYGEMPDCQKVKRFRKMAIEKLLNAIIKQTY